MEKVIKWAKKNHKLLIALFVFLVIFLILFFSYKKIMNYLSPSSKKSVYGDRCDSVENTPFTKDMISDLKKFINENENFTVVEIKNKCKLIDIVINLDNPQEFQVVDDFGKEILEKIPSAIFEKYDIQLFVTSSDEKDENYPKIGSHHKFICSEKEKAKNEEKCKQSDRFTW